MFLNKFWKILIPILNIPSPNRGCEDINVIQGRIISSSINSSVEPCEDFYTYACGNYANQHTATDYQEITTYMDLQYNNLILKLMENKYPYDFRISDQCQTFVDKTRLYLQACRRETKRNLKKYFEHVKPAAQLDWPLLEEVENKLHESSQWPDNNQFNVWFLLGQLQSFGMNNVLINQEVLVDKNGEISIMLEPAFTENESFLPDVNILKVFLLSLGVKTPGKVLNYLNKTNKVLLYILRNYGALEEEDMEITFGELEVYYPNLDLSSYLNELLSQQLAADTYVLVRKPSYFQHLNDNMWLALEQKSLCNYLMMKFLYFLALDSTAEFNSLSCVKDLRNKFDLSVNFLYYSHIFSQQAKLIEPDIKQLFNNLRNSLANYFKENHLQLTNSEIKILLDKLAKVRLNIGNIPTGSGSEEIEQFYSGLPALDGNNYYKNHLLMLKHRFIKSLHYAPKQTHFIVSDKSLDSSSGAFYVTKQNMIILPYGSLLQPMYDVQYHDLYKYSLLGFILAHELTHAFDTYSLYADSQTEDSANEDSLAILNNNNFQNSVKCLQSQLATSAIDERIADIVGIQIVYKIYVSKYNNLQPPFLKPIWNKYFYLNLAQFFCGKNDIKFLDHDSDAERLHQIVANSRGFRKAFKCPPNSKLSPTDTCRLY